MLHTYSCFRLECIRKYRNIFISLDVTTLLVNIKILPSGERVVWRRAPKIRKTLKKERERESAWKREEETSARRCTLPSILCMISLSLAADACFRASWKRHIYLHPLVRAPTSRYTPNPSLCHVLPADEALLVLFAVDRSEESNGLPRKKREVQETEEDDREWNDVLPLSYNNSLSDPSTGE